MLDKDVVEFAWTLPIDLKLGEGGGKQVLRDVLHRYVPREMMDRPKKGFSVPVKKWLKEPALRRWADELMNPELVRRQGFLDGEVVSRIWNDFISKDIWRPQIWYILMFQEWLLNVGRTGNACYVLP